MNSCCSVSELSPNKLEYSNVKYMLSTDCRLSGYGYIAKQYVLLYTHTHTRARAIKPSFHHMECGYETSHSTVNT